MGKSTFLRFQTMCGRHPPERFRNVALAAEQCVLYHVDDVHDEEEESHEEEVASHWATGKEYASDG